jgi:serine/threonine protein kinase
MIGRLIGNYKVLEKIGEGGMGSVWRGVDIMLDREVAIKMLRPELANDPQIVERFRAEAVTLARLNHPNIATLYAFLRQGNDYFMVMEYVRGETLSHAISRIGPISCTQTLKLFGQVLEGVHHAHEMGIIHRDIKPANVMLTPNASVKVMDFGIARALSASRMTRTGHLIGTLEYMAPELIQGAGGDVRSDIYALGLLLYEMLTGRLPFESNSDYELMRAQVEAAPLPPRHFAPHIPLDIEQALMRALAKRANARFQTAAEFRAALLNSIPATGQLQNQALADGSRLNAASRPLASAALPDNLKETRLADEGVASPLVAPLAPQSGASQPGSMSASAAPYIKPTRLGGEDASSPASQPQWPAHHAEAVSVPHALPIGSHVQAACAAGPGRQRGSGFAKLFEKLDWRHYAGFGALLLLILSVPFLLVSKSDERPASQPATTTRPPSAPESNAMTPTSQPESAPPSKPINAQPALPATGSSTASPDTSPAPSRRERARRSGAQPERGAKPSATDRGNNDAKKEDQGGRKEEKKGGIFRKLKKLNPFGHGDKNKD